MSSRPGWIFNVHDESAGVPRKLAEGLRARVFTGEHVQLSIVRVEPHSAGAVHSHPQEQWGVLLEGECVRVQQGVEAHVRPGDFWHTPAGVVHGIRTGASHALVLDVFSPIREEYAVAGEGVGAGATARKP